MLLTENDHSRQKMTQRMYIQCLACTMLLFFQCPQMVSVAVDVKEVSTAYIFEGDMPGLKNTDIKVHLHKRVSLCHTLMLHENHMIDYNSE